MRKISDIPSMRFYRPTKPARSVFLHRPVRFVTKRDWRVDVALAVLGTVVTFLVVCWILL